MDKYEKIANEIVQENRARLDVGGASYGSRVEVPFESTVKDIAQALREAAAEAIEDVRDSWYGGTLSDFIQHIESKIAALRGKSWE